MRIRVVARWAVRVALLFAAAVAPVAVVVADFARLEPVGVGVCVSGGSQEWRIGGVVAVGLVLVDEAAAGNRHVSAGLVWNPSGAAASSPVQT